MPLRPSALARSDPRLWSSSLLSTAPASALPCPVCTHVQHCRRAYTTHTRRRTRRTRQQRAQLVRLSARAGGGRAARVGDALARGRHGDQGVHAQRADEADDALCRHARAAADTQAALRLLGVDEPGAAAAFGRVRPPRARTTAHAPLSHSMPCVATPARAAWRGSHLPISAVAFAVLPHALARFGVDHDALCARTS
eukprot:6201438-Pleurochrysis_carterae.AAC.2